MSENDPLTYAIIGAALTVHRTLGQGFLEPIYQQAMEHELFEKGIPYERECSLPIYYRDKILRTSFRFDFLCFGSVLVEIKALRELSGVEEGQVINYLNLKQSQVRSYRSLSSPP